MTEWYGRKIEVAYDACYGGLTFYVLRRLTNGQLQVAQPVAPLAFVDVPEGARMEPTLILDEHEALELVRQVLPILEGLGRRLTNEPAIEAALKATTYHLEDLRTLLKLRRP